MEEKPKVGVAAIIIKGDKMLLGKRKGAHGQGSWGFPGGHLELNESIEECVSREVFEETGMSVKYIRKSTFTNDIFENEGRHYVTLFAVAKWDSGEPELKEPERCERWEWFRWNELPKPLFLPIQNLIKQDYDPFRE